MLSRYFPNLSKMCYSCPAELGYITLDFDNEVNPEIYGLHDHTYMIWGGDFHIDMAGDSLG